MSLTWDTLPGESATNIVDAEDALGRIVYQIDRGSNGVETDYDLHELRQDIDIVKDCLIRIEGDLTR